MDLRELPYIEDAQALFPALLDMPYPALLHSADRTHPEARHDILVADPEQVVSWDPSRRDDPLATLTSALPPADSPRQVPFATGFVGYLGYPMHVALEDAGPLPPDPCNLPALAGGIYRWSVVTDHRARRTVLQMDPMLSAAERNLLHRRCLRLTRFTAAQPLVAEPFTSELVGDRYRDAFQRVMRYLHEGDCYQVNLARHFGAPHAGPAQRSTLVRAAWQTYRELLPLQPGAFGGFLGGPWGAILSFSPERFVRFGNRHVETRPIKGTRPRCEDPAQDRRQREALARSGKDRAENLMIVDLMRNDLGRVCELGSVRVERLFDVESLANVHHLVSTISGVPRRGVTAADTLRAVFPGGSITGAPKIRAMEIINELEPVGRSVFCGSIGYIDACGNMDTNIAIRTLVVDPEQIHAWGGGGIVADSEADLELAEIDHKVAALLQAVSRAPSRRSWSAA